MIVSDNETIINAALKYYDMFKIPVNQVAAKKVKRQYDACNKADLDFKTSNNKIGEIVNLSQELNTIMWNIVNDSKNQNLTHGELYEKIRDLYYNICQLSVMSGIEIDKAKKEFEVNADKEIKKIKEEYLEKDDDGKTIKPGFLGYIAKTKGYYNPEKKSYVYQDTTMDYLVKVISSSKATKGGKCEFIPFASCFEFDDFDIKRVNYDQIKKIITWCTKAKEKIFMIQMCDYYTGEEKQNLVALEKEILSAKINSLNLNKYTIFHLIKSIDDKKNSSISRFLFYILFSLKNNFLSELVIQEDIPNTILDICSSGDIQIYDLKYGIFSLGSQKTSEI